MYQIIKYYLIYVTYEKCKKKNFYFVKFLKGGSASLDDWI